MIILLSILVILFPVGILLKKIFPRLCAICFATSVAWILGLLYMLIGLDFVGEIDLIPLGIFMGGSVVGSMYYLSSKLQKEKQLFKLPYIVTLFTFVNIIITRDYGSLIIIGNLILWLMFLTMYWMRNNKSLKQTIARVIECCKNW